ncbi:MAG: hypothetical protein LBG87_06535 [Spirochaetaceae bacterium]|nr:hypothetical protein [Spirochaetaceae bacterium]
MKRMLTAMLCTAVLSGLGALEITGTAPQFELTDPSGIPTEVDIPVDTLNGEVSTLFNQALDQINGQIANIDGTPEKVIKAFGNASVYSSTGATLRNYAGYRLFGVALGAMFGAQLPYSIFEVIGNPDIGTEVMDKLEKEKDMVAGINAQGVNLQFGLNMSFLVKNLYLGVKAGYFPGNAFLSDNFKFTTWSFGVTASYQFFPKMNVLPIGLLVWRGLSVNSGVIYQGTAMGMEMPLDKVSINNGNFNLSIDPKAALDITVHTVTIPIEAVTSVRLLWILNLAVGLGIDVGFGSSKIAVSATGDINADPQGAYSGYIRQSKAGSISLNAGGTEGPSIFHPKLMLGLGLSLGPVLIDIPITFYLNNGYSAGVTIGFTL